MTVYNEDLVEMTDGYLRESHARLGEIALISQYAQKTGGPILELAAGAGRVMIQMSKRGYDVFGIELSHFMIERGLKEVAKLDPQVRNRIRFQLGDMTNFSLSNQFPLVVVPFNSFWTNLDEKGAEKCLLRILAQLSRGGTFLIDHPFMFSNERHVAWWRLMARKHQFVYETPEYEPHNPQASSGSNTMLVGNSL
jgi:SAM-dependent methyltransferase